MASLDTRRPAAQEQLRQLGEQTGIDTLPVIAGQTPVDIAARAVQAGRLGGYDVVILDTAGRTHIDEPLMVEMADIRSKAQPARNPAGRRFADRPGRGEPRAQFRQPRRHHRHRADPHRRRRARRRGAFDARGHRQADQADRHRREDGRAGGFPSRSASPTASSAWATSSAWSRRPPRTSTRKRPQAIAKRMQKGEFDLDDLADQLKQMQNLGGMGGIMGMLPGVGKMKKQMRRRRPRRQHASSASRRSSRR